jgi:hypothetical protein
MNPEGKGVAGMAYTITDIAELVRYHPDGHHYAEDGGFYCADCWEVGAGTPSS